MDRHQAATRRAVRSGVLGALAVLVLAGCPAPRDDRPGAQASGAPVTAVNKPEAASPTSGVEGSPSQDHSEATSSGERTFTAPPGAVQRGTRLSFDVDADATQITNVVAEVLESCDGSSGSSATTIGPNLTWDIVDGSFSGRQKEVVDGVSVYTTLEGRLIDAESAEGIIRQESVVAGSVCDTYELSFTADARERE